MWWRRTQFRWLPKRTKMCELSRWPCSYIKRLPQMENWERHCDPQIYRKDFIRRCSETITTFFRPIKGFICNCNTDPSSIFKTSSTMGGDGGGRPSSVMSLGVTSVGGHSHGHPASPIGVGSSWEDIDPRSPEPLVVRGGWLWLIWVVRWTT